MPFSKLLVEGAGAGYGSFDQVQGGWANRLKLDTSAYNEAYPSNQIIIENRALPNMLLSGIMKSYRGHLEAADGPGVKIRPILSTGLNEAKLFAGKREPAIPLDEFGGLLQNFGDTNQQFGLGPAILIGPQRVDESRTRPVYRNDFLSFTIENDTVADYNKIVRASAEASGATFVDTFNMFGESDDLNDLLANDGYHPNAVGHEAIHSAVRSALGYDYLAR